MFNTERYRRDAYFNADCRIEDTPTLSESRKNFREWLSFVLKFCLGCIIMLVLLVGLKICIAIVEYHSFGNQENVFVLRKLSAIFSKADTAPPVQAEIGTTAFSFPANAVIFNKQHLLPTYRRTSLELSWRTGGVITPQHSLYNLLRWQEDIVWAQVHALTDMTQLNEQNRLLVEDMQTKTGDPLKEGVNFFASKSNGAFTFAVVYKQGAVPLLFKCEKSLSFIKIPACTTTVKYKETILITYSIAQSVLAETPLITATLKNFLSANETVAKPNATLATE
jgi:hypothetical protein